MSLKRLNSELVCVTLVTFHDFIQFKLQLWTIKGLITNLVFKKNIYRIDCGVVWVWRQRLYLKLIALNVSIKKSQFVIKIVKYFEYVSRNMKS